MTDDQCVALMAMIALASGQIATQKEAVQRASDMLVLARESRAER